MVSDNFKGAFYVTLSTIGFSMIPILAKIGFDAGANANTILFYRVAISFLIFISYLIIKKQS